MNEVRTALTLLTNFAARQVRLRYEGKPIEGNVTDKEAEFLKLVERIALEAEIQLLRDTAKGFQQELKPEYAKGGQAAINALIAMADHKERELQELEKHNG